MFWSLIYKDKLLSVENWLEDVAKLGVLESWLAKRPLCEFTQLKVWPLCYRT